MTVIKLLATLLIVGGLFFAKTLWKLSILRKRVAREISEIRVEKIKDSGSVQSLTVLPLVDYYASRDDLKTEAAVSYHIAADGTNILMDVGANGKKEHPSPLIHNMEKLGVRLEDLTFLYISHVHLDHVGGMREQKTREFSFSAGSVTLPAIPVYSPEPLKPSARNPGPDARVINEPVVLAEGVVSIGTIPRALYLLGYTVENALAVKIEGKGIALIIGCGHQTIERIIERARALFDDPIYAIIGGLHLPGGGGRMKIGPVDIQPIVGTDRFPWKKLNLDDTRAAIEAVKKVNPEILALSPHDSSDASLDMFSQAFGDRFQVIQAGRPIVL